MKNLFFLAFIICFSIQFIFGQNEISNLDSTVVIGKFTDKHFELVNGKILKKYIDNRLNPDVELFDSIELESVTLDSIDFHFIKLSRIDKKMTLIKWLEVKDDLLYLGHSPMGKFETLTNYTLCQGDTTCFPRLMKIEGVYYLSCTEDPSCLSPQYSKEHCQRSTLYFE